jgi:AraC-like DNA-binding protein
MYPVERALWFIENRIAGDISLQAIAASAGVSSHHLARAFGAATGQSLMRYARGRRLSEAARSLSAGAPDILAVALDAGYGSHEAFTRAFREQFGVTPEECRVAGDLDHFKLVEPIRMDKSLLIDLDEPRFEDFGEFLVAGLGARYTFAKNEGIPNQWRRFEPYTGNLPNQNGPETYGVCCNADNSGMRVATVRAPGNANVARTPGPAMTNDSAASPPMRVRAADENSAQAPERLAPELSCRSLCCKRSRRRSRRLPGPVFGRVGRRFPRRIFGMSPS